MPLSATPPSGPVTLSSNARTVLEKRYLVKDKTGKPTETPESLFWRVATVVAEADARYGANEDAVQAVADKKWGHMVALQTPHIVTVPIIECLRETKRVDITHDVVQTARATGISFGD